MDCRYRISLYFLPLKFCIYEAISSICPPREISQWAILFLKSVECWIYDQRESQTWVQTQLKSRHLKQLRVAIKSVINCWDDDTMFVVFISDQMIYYHKHREHVQCCSILLINSEYRNKISSHSHHSSLCW